MKEKDDSILFDPYRTDIVEKIDIKEILDYSVILSEIAKALIKYRQDLEITQKQLAKMLNIRQSMISKLESGDYNPTFKMLLKISYKLEKNSEFFVTIIENIRKTIVRTEQYKDIKKNVKYKNIQIINNSCYKYEKNYILMDINIKNNMINNNENYKYKMNIQ